MSAMGILEERDWLRGELQRAEGELSRERAARAHVGDIVLGFEVEVAHLHTRIGEMEQQLRDQGEIVARLRLEAVTNARLHQRAGLHLAAGLLEDEAYAIAAEEIAREACRDW